MRPYIAGGRKSIPIQTIFNSVHRWTNTYRRTRIYQNISKMTVSWLNIRLENGQTDGQTSSKSFSKPIGIRKVESVSTLCKC